MTTQELKTSFENLYQASAEAIYFFLGRGYKWAMAHYLSPIATQHFLITSKDGSDVTMSQIYQNPGWSTTANTGAQN